MSSNQNEVIALDIDDDDDDIVVNVGTAVGSGSGGGGGGAASPTAILRRRNKRKRQRQHQQQQQQHEQLLAASTSTSTLTSKEIVNLKNDHDYDDENDGNSSSSSVVDLTPHNTTTTTTATSTATAAPSEKDSSASIPVMADAIRIDDEVHNAVNVHEHEHLHAPGNNRRRRRREISSSSTLTRNHTNSTGIINIDDVFVDANGNGNGGGKCNGNEVVNLDDDDDNDNELQYHRTISLDHKRRRNQNHTTINSTSSASASASANTSTATWNNHHAISVDDEVQVAAPRRVKGVAHASSSSSSTTAGVHGGGTNDIQVVQVKQSPPVITMQSIIEQVTEILPLMDPMHITQHFSAICNSTSTPISLTPPETIAHFIQTSMESNTYPKIEPVKKKKHTSSSKHKHYEKSNQKQVDYANDEYEQSPTYKREAYDRLLHSFPCMSLDGVKRLLEHYNGRYFKTYMHLVDKIKTFVPDVDANKADDDSEKITTNVARYNEVMRVMNGGRLTEAQRDILTHTSNNISFKTTLKKPRKKESKIVTDVVLKDEIRFTTMRMREWGRSIDKEKKRMEARKQSKKDGSMVECLCCYGDFAFMEMVSCGEGHLFCMDCLKRYAQEKIFGNGDLGGGGATELKCMNMDGCQSFFSRDQLGKSLDKKVIAKYDELQASLVLEQAGLTDALVKCPECDFQAELPETQMVLECPNCGYESCRKCGEEPHIPLRCEEVEKKTETSARLQVEEAMTKARIRHCPKGCKQGFYKTEGCNKMTCPTCKTWICYVCRVEIPKNVSYGHFCQTPHCQHQRCNKCPLYSNAEEDDARATREAGLKAVQDLKDGEKTSDIAKKMEESILNEDQAAERNNRGPRLFQRARGHVPVPMHQPQYAAAAHHLADMMGNHQQQFDNLMNQAMGRHQVYRQNHGRRGRPRYHR